MRLLIVSSHFPNIVGGVSDYIYHLSRVLAGKGFEVYIMTSSDSRITRYVGGNVKVLALVDGWGLRGLPGIVREIKKINPDCVMLQYVPYMYSRYGVPVSIPLLSVLLRITGFKLVTTFHEIAVGFDLKKPKRWAATILQRLIAYVICAASDGIIITAEAYRRTIESFGGKIRKIPIGSNILPTYISSEERELLKREIAPAQEVVISTFGANPRRNDLLIKVAKKLIDESIRIKLLIVGGVPKDWIQTVKEKVKSLNLEGVIYFTGYLKSEDVYKYLSISDIFIILETVDKKGMGGISVKNTSLAAALAAGLPVVANQGHMTDDFLHHNRNIVLIDSLNEGVIAEEIKKLLANPALMENLKKGATGTFETEISWQAIARKHIEILNGETNRI